METEINYDQMYPKIYHQTPSLLKWTRMYWLMLLWWHDVVIKDAVVRQVTLSVTDMDKINIVSSQAVLKMSFFTMDTCSMSSSPLLVKNRLFKTTPDIDEPPFQFIHTMDLSVVDTMLHDNPDLVIHGTEIWAVWRPQAGRKKVWRFLMQQFNCCTCTMCRCTHCPAGTQSHYQTVCVSLAAVWRHYDVMKQRRSRQ